MHLPLLVAALLCSFSTAPALKADVPVVAVPLRVTLLLLNFDINRHFSPGDLSKLLRDVMPFYSPRDVTDVVFEIAYSAHSDIALSPSSSAYGKRTNAFMGMFADFVEAAHRERSSGGSKGTNFVDEAVELSTQQLSKFLRRIIAENDNSKVDLRASLTNLPFIIINGNASSASHIAARRRKYVIPHHSSSSSSSSELGPTAGMCTQHLIDDVLFLDSGADFCTNNLIIRDDRIETNRVIEVTGTRGAFSKRITVPFFESPFPLHFPAANSESNNNRIFDELHNDPLLLRNHYKSQVASVVTSGIKQTLVGSLRYKVSQRKERIFMPVIFIDNDPRSGAPDDAASAAVDTLRGLFIDAERVGRYVQKHLLPSQELVMLQSRHNIFEHPQVSVVLSSSHMLYRSFNPQDNLVDKVPYISADAFFREAREKVFDELVSSALADAGRAAAFMQGDASRRVSKHGSGKAPKELVGAWLRDSVTMSDASYGDEDASNARADVAIVPVFVLSNLYFHNNIGSSSRALPAGRDGINVQPLIDKDKLVGYDSDSAAAIIVHSSANSSDPYQRVMYYDTVSNSYNGIDTSDINKLVAEAALSALTGLSAPHLNAQEGGYADYTWSTGNHPFHEHGLANFTEQATGEEGSGGVLQAAAVRTIVTSRLHSAMYMALQIGAGAATAVAEAKDALTTLQAVGDVTGSKRRRDKVAAEAGRELVELVKMYARFDKLATDNENSISRMKKVMDEASVNADGAKLLTELVVLEKSVSRNKRSLLASERALMDNLRKCKVIYDPASLRTPSAHEAREPRLSIRRHLRGWGGAAIAALLTAAVAAVMFGLVAMQQRVQQRAKKLK